MVCTSSVFQTFTWAQGELIDKLLFLYLSEEALPFLYLSGEALLFLYLSGEELLLQSIVMIDGMPVDPFTE